MSLVRQNQTTSMALPRRVSIPVPSRAKRYHCGFPALSCGGAVASKLLAIH